MVPLEPQEDRLKHCVNLVSVVMTTEVGQPVEEGIRGHCFYKTFLVTSDCQQRMEPLGNFPT